MAKLTVDVVKIDEVQPHPNAERLSLARVGGYWIITGLDEYKAGDQAVYFPVDSILPKDLQVWLFRGSKMKLTRNRIKATKIRRVVSHGLLSSRDTIIDWLIADKQIVRVSLGDDLTKALGVTKFQPPAKLPRGMQTSSNKTKPYCHPAFPKYTSINHLRKFHRLFKTGELVRVSEKLHGTNFRCGWVPYIPRTFFGRILKTIFGFRANKWEFIFGSHNVQLTPGLRNVYSRIVGDHDLKNKIRKGHIWYGEIVGQGIQKNYEYHIQGVDVYFFDVLNVTSGQYLNWRGARETVEKMSEKMVPNWTAPFDLETITRQLNQPVMVSEIDGYTKAEGLVIRSFTEARKLGQRQILKLISDQYLLGKCNTDFH